MTNQSVYLLSMVLISVCAITTNLNNMCSCSELENETNCEQSSPMCAWNNNKCVDEPCSNIQVEDLCLHMNKRCYWSQSQCKDFTSCSQLKGNSTNDCKMQNMYCPATNGTICEPVNMLNTCESINSTDSCNHYFSKAGRCLWSGNACTVASSCSQFYNSTSNTCTFAGCYLSSNNTCLPMTCSQLKTATECYKGLIILGPYLQNAMPCAWNYQTGVCGDFNPNDIDNQQCYVNTISTYHWSSKKNNKGTCEQCLETLLLGIFIVSTLSLLL